MKRKSFLYHLVYAVICLLSFNITNICYSEEGVSFEYETPPPCDSGGSITDIPLCPDVGQPRTIVHKRGSFEAAAFDMEGRLVFSNWLGNKIHILDSPETKPRTILEHVWRPGGLALMPDGMMLIGSGIDVRSTLAPALGFARLLRFEPNTGEHSVYAKGLSMGNGIVLASDGTVFASNDLAQSLDRIDPDGTVHRGWYRDSATNGLAVSPDGRTLYANVSIGNTRILAIDIETGESEVYFTPPAGLEWVFLDDLDIDSEGRLYAAVYFGGQVWRITPGDGSCEVCALARGLVLPAGITVGASGAGFSPTSVYVTTHLGKVIEIPGAVPAQ